MPPSLTNKKRRLIFFISFSALFILSSYSIHLFITTPKQEIAEFQRQAELKTNPKRILWKSAIYEKGTYQKLGEGGTRLPQKYDYQYCKSKVYKLLKDAPKQNTTAYLRQFDKEFHELHKQHSAANPTSKPKTIQQKNEIKLLVAKERILTTWLPLHELNYDLFNPEENLHGKYLNNYLDYLDCKDYLTEITEKPKTGIKIYPEEEFYGWTTRWSYNSKTLSAILQDPDTLIRADISEQKVKIEYYSTKYRAYIETYMKLRTQTDHKS